MEHTVLHALNYCGVTPTDKIMSDINEWFNGWDPCDCRDFDTAVWTSVVEFCELHNLGCFSEE